MKPKTMIAALALAALPFFAVASAEQTDQASQPAVEQSAGSTMMTGHAMHHGMMNLVDQVKNDLAALANESDLTVLHTRLAHDQGLLEQIQSHMHSMYGMAGSMMPGHSMMSGGMMSGHMSNCPGAVQQSQK